MSIEWDSSLCSHKWATRLASYSNSRATKLTMFSFEDFLPLYWGEQKLLWTHNKLATSQHTTTLVSAARWTMIRATKLLYSPIFSWPFLAEVHKICCHNLERSIVSCQSTCNWMDFEFQIDLRPHTTFLIQHSAYSRPWNLFYPRNRDIIKSDINK